MTILSDFVEEIVYPYKTCIALDQFIGACNGIFKPNSGGSGSLGMRMHKTIQTSIGELIRHQNTASDALARKEQELDARKKLMNELVRDITDEAVITDKTKLNTADVAEHFMENIFDPIYKKAKQLNALTANPS